jgi:hypothetical protein
MNALAAWIVYFTGPRVPAFSAVMVLYMLHALVTCTGSDAAADWLAALGAAHCSLRRPNFRKYDPLPVPSDCSQSLVRPDILPTMVQQCVPQCLWSPLIRSGVFVGLEQSYLRTAADR